MPEGPGQGAETPVAPQEQSVSTGGSSGGAEHSAGHAVATALRTEISAAQPAGKVMGDLANRSEHNIAPDPLDAELKALNAGEHPSAPSEPLHASDADTFSQELANVQDVSGLAASEPNSSTVIEASPIIGGAQKSPDGNAITSPSTEQPAAAPDSAVNLRQQQDAIFDDNTLTTEERAAKLIALQGENIPGVAPQATDSTEPNTPEPSSTARDKFTPEQLAQDAKIDKAMGQVVSPSGRAILNASRQQARTSAEAVIPGGDSPSPTTAEATQPHTETAENGTDSARVEGPKTPEQFQAEQRVLRDETVAILKAKNPELDLRNPDLQKALAEAEADPTGEIFRDMQEAGETISEAQKTAEARAEQYGGLTPEQISELASGDVQSLADNLRKIADALDKSGKPGSKEQAKKMNRKLKILLIILAAIVAVPAVATAGVTALALNAAAKQQQ